MKYILCILFFLVAGCSTVNARIPLPDGTFAEVKAFRFLTSSDVQLTDPSHNYSLVYGQKPQDAALLDLIQKLLPILAAASSGALGNVVH